MYQTYQAPQFHVIEKKETSFVDDLGITYVPIVEFVQSQPHE